MAAVLCWVLGSLPIAATGLGEGVDTALGQSGVENRVTAVILNFRGYDTLLEIGVLFLAVVAVSALRAAGQGRQRRTLPPMGPILNVFLRTLTPLLVLTAGYLLWIGAHAPGGAFQAGAVLAAIGVVLLLTGVRIGLTFENAWRRAAAAAGFLVFLLVGTSTMATGRNFLEYPTEFAKYLILFIEIAATISIAFTLATLFAVCAALLATAPPARVEASEELEL
jgi:multisubunit Na+/H+ antiporter MnhB subunit